jgi:hypothetical protein
MSEPRIQEFFHATKLSAPKIAHFIEARVDVNTQFRNSRVCVANPPIVDQNAYQDGKHVPHGGQGDSKELRIALPLLTLSRLAPVPVPR